MIKKIKHVGVATNSIDETMKLWKEAFGAEVLKRDPFEMMGQESALVKIGESYVELMQPLEGADKSTVRKYLETHGEGVHHLSLLSDNLAEDLETLKSQGVKILGEGAPVVFTHPKTSLGIVYEITEMDDLEMDQVLDK